jgi:hypothetical protein
MNVGKEAILRVHAGCCNGHDVEGFLPHCMPQARMICDGLLVGEGHEAIRKTLSEEFGEGVVGRVMSVGGEPAMVEWSEAGEPRAIVRLEAEGDRVSEIRIEHGEALRRLVASGR